MSDGIAGVTGAWGAQGGRWSVLVHGGAGDVAAGVVSRHEEGCRRAAEAAAAILAADGDALDAAVRAVEVLEDDPVFNAGTGACLDEDGRLSLDACVMEGHDLRAGGVAALPSFRHPIAVARAVMRHGAHVLLAGAGAERFALGNGFDREPEETMITASAREVWEKVKRGALSSNWAGGTVGAVVRDARGTVAAATSTGGRVNKLSGRVGDSPVPGAGTYADDDGGAASNTGDGEAVLRLSLGKTAVEWMRLGMDAEEAARGVIRLMHARLGGRGGIILVDRLGRVGLARSTKTMTWAAASEGWEATRSGF